MGIGNNIQGSSMLLAARLDTRIPGFPGHGSDQARVAEYPHNDFPYPYIRSQ